MATSLNSKNFFETGYKSLREKRPMIWMTRLFKEILLGETPRLLDLQTGAGKTELAVIWLLSLSWIGKNQLNESPVPRRLAWVVNRRVLVQQVFRIACELQKKLTSSTSPELDDVRAGLRALSGTDGEVFKVVELRGQIVADRDWAIRPAVPQLIIGTVDQIGSRILFQGYGLGKWGRPQQAGLLGLDAWVAVDEAHLVPAFVLTLRQIREQCASAEDSPPAPFGGLFARLPFWLTELSATPGLPPPSDKEPFSLTDVEKADEPMRDRLLASTARIVRVESFPAGKKAAETKAALVAKLVSAAMES